MAGVLGWYTELNNNVRWCDILLTTSVLLVIYVFYQFAIKPFLSPLRKLPGPGYNPIFGNVREGIHGNTAALSSRWLKKYGGIMRFYHLLGAERVLVMDPEAIRHIAVTNVKNYIRGTVNSNRSSQTRQIFGEGIFLVDGKEHKLQRRMLNPLFNQENVRYYIAHFAAGTQNLVEYWQKQIALTSDGKAEVAVADDMSRMTLDIIGSSVLGHDFDSLNNPADKFSNAVDDILRIPPIRFSSILRWLDRLPTAANRRFAHNLKIVDDTIYSMIRTKRATQLSDDADRTRDLLDRLLLARDEDTGEGLTDKQLRDQLVSIIIAGHQTTSATLAWILLSLAQHPEIQEKVRQEVDAVLPPIGEAITSKHIDQLEYLTCVVKETQRLYPAAPSLARRAVADDTIMGYFIPAGTMIVYHIGALMRNPAIWPDPDRFDPDRFVGHEANTSYTHLPFLTGQYKCLGHLFAKMEMKVVLALLLRQLRFEMVPGMTFERVLNIVQKSDPPVRLVVSQA